MTVSDAEKIVVPHRLVLIVKSLANRTRVIENARRFKVGHAQSESKPADACVCVFVYPMKFGFNYFKTVLFVFDNTSNVCMYMFMVRPDRATYVRTYGTLVREYYS